MFENEHAFLQILLNEYQFVSRAFLKNDTYMIYHQPGKEDLMQPEQTAGFRTAVPEWIARFASAEDCPALILQTAPEVLSAVLKEQKELVLGFRGSAELSSACYEWKIVRGDDFDTTGEIWLLLKKSSEDAALLQKYRHRAEDLGNIVVGMADYYDSIGIFDLYTQKEEQYRQSKLFNEQIPDWNTTDNYTERMQMFCDTLVIEEERESFMQLVSVELLLDRIEKGYFCHIVDFHIRVRDKIEWYRVNFVHEPRTKDNPRMIVGIGSIDGAIHRLMEERAVINSLGIDFDFIAYINLFTMDTEVYKDDKSLLSGLVHVDYEKFTKHINADITQYVHPEDADMVREAIVQENLVKNVKEKGIVSFRFRVCLGERTIYYQAKFLLLHLERETQIVIGVRDIDEIVNREHEYEAYLAEKAERQQALEEALRLAQSANRAKTTFLNNISHDMRTPMNAIIGYTNMAFSHIDRQERVEDCLSKIRTASDHLLSLINDVLDMSRIETGQVTLNEKPENLSDVLHNLCDIVRADILAKHQQLLLDADSITDEQVICDKVRLNQVLMNIISNSNKYTPEGGCVSIVVRQTGHTETGFGQYEFTVRDTGIGMSPEFLKTIFEPFTREKSATVSGIQGSGLGMTITKNIVDMMGGTIHISSTQGAGTEVVISVQFHLQQEIQPMEPLPAFVGKRALVIDDDLLCCTSAASMLRELGIRCEWCQSASEALTLIENAQSTGDRFELFLVDWVMNEMNGSETVQRIRKICNEPAPIIIQTAYDRLSIADDLASLSVDGFVSKPLFPSDLYNALSGCTAPEPEPEEAAEADDFTGKTVLLVEDNEMNREIAEDILMEYGLTVDSAEDGSIAVEKVRDMSPGQYDMIIMDIQMPIMDGYEATRQIRKLENQAAATLPIVAMTANAFQEDREAAFAAGMNDHLAKPIDIDLLEKVLKKYLSR